MRRSLPPLLLFALSSSCAAPDEALRAEVAGLRARLEALEYEVRQHPTPGPAPSLEEHREDPGRSCHDAFEASLRTGPAPRAKRVPVSISTELGGGELASGCVKELFLGPGPCRGQGVELDPDNPKAVGLPPGRGSVVFRAPKGARCVVTLDVPPEGGLAVVFTATGAKVSSNGKEELHRSEPPAQAKLKLVAQQPGAQLGRGCSQTALGESCVDSAHRADAGPLELVVPAGAQQLRLQQEGMEASFRSLGRLFDRLLVA